MAWWGAVVFPYLLNGITDVAEDRANGSRRPIARAALPVRAARWTAAAVAVVALGLGAAIGGGLVSLAFLALGWVYSGAAAGGEAVEPLLLGGGVRAGLDQRSGRGGPHPLRGPGAAASAKRPQPPQLPAGDGV